MVNSPNVVNKHQNTFIREMPFHLGSRPAHAREHGSRAAGASGSGPRERRSGARGSSAGIPCGLAPAVVSAARFSLCRRPTPPQFQDEVARAPHRRPAAHFLRPATGVSLRRPPDVCGGGHFPFFKWGTVEDHCVARKYDLGFFLQNVPRY
jgi:hypothetical protein